MTYQRQVFNSVKTSATKSGKCSVCGKRCRLSITFEQSANTTFNVNSKGEPKTEAEIRKENADDIKMWKENVVITHKKCQ